jgi:4-amino-4-deoxy-L-arabinose transferase-like glycosyltransferase
MPVRKGAVCGVRQRFAASLQREFAWQHDLQNRWGGVRLVSVLSRIERRASQSFPLTFLAAAVVIVVCLFGQLGAIGLVGPDEPRYAWIARAMAATGDWVTPRLYGQPWFEKPILYYWAAAIGFKLHLPAEWAARLPSAVAALAAALAIGWLGWKHYGADGGIEVSPALLAPLLFSCTVAAIGFARAATPDMLFSASIALAMASAASELRAAGALRGIGVGYRVAGGGSAALISFGALLGLAVLAKGPAAIVLAGGAILLWALATRQWRAALRLAHPSAIVAFCLVALPWYVLCTLRNRQFLHVFIFQHNFERYLTPIFQHRQPVWFFAPIILAALLPWTVLLWPVARKGLRIRRENSWRDSPGLFWGCWAVFPVLFFSFSASKLPGYVLPSIPPLALLCSVALARAISPRPSTERMDAMTIAVGVGVTWIALGIASLYWMPRLPAAARDSAGHDISVVAVVAIAGGVGVAVLGILRRRVWVALALALVAVSTEGIGVGVLPPLDPIFSARWHAQFLHNDLHPDRIFTYDLPRSWNYGLAFYMRRELPEWSPNDPNAALILTDPRGMREIRRLGRLEGELDETDRGILYVPAAPIPQRLSTDR